MTHGRIFIWLEIKDILESVKDKQVDGAVLALAVSVQFPRSLGLFRFVKEVRNINRVRYSSILKTVLLFEGNYFIRNGQGLCCRRQLRLSTELTKQEDLKD